MRVAILADLRGNLQALQAVLRHLDGQDIDRLWFIGSQFSYGPDPAAIAELLWRAGHRERCLIGHPDGRILNPRRLDGVNPAMRRSSVWAHRQLCPHPWSAWSRRWRWLTSRRTAGESDGFQFFSGTPQDPEAGFLAIVPVDLQLELRSDLELVRTGAFVATLGRPGIVLADDLVWRDASPGQPFPLVGRRFIACPGSVGQPRDDDPRAAYAVHDGISLTWHRVEYDVEETVRRIAAIPELPETYGLRLRVGR